MLVTPQLKSFVSNLAIGLPTYVVFWFVAAEWRWYLYMVGVIFLWDAMEVIKNWTADDKGRNF